MVARHGLDLAISIIKSHFGDLVAQVCSCLLNRGSLSLDDTIRFTELDRSNVKKCLLVLIQHNCVQAFSAPFKVGSSGAIKSVTLYMAIFDNVIHRLRFSKFLLIVAKNLDPKCEALLEGLLQHGRLTFDQLVVRATANQPEANRDVVRESFNRLVNAHYVERCPRPEPFIECSESGTVTARSRLAEAAKPSLEQQAIRAAALSDAERFSGISDIVKEPIEDGNTTEHTPNVSVGEKRRHEVLEDDTDVQATITENEILWRANFEMLVHCFKKKACVDSVSLRLGPDAGKVLEAIIESNCEQNSKSSVTASMDAILEGVRGRGITTLDLVRVILEQLGCCLCTDETGAIYSVDLQGIIETCKNEEVETLVLKRYGKEAYRIFRLLAKEGRHYETDQIADITFIEKKESQGILYRLWKDNYLDMKNLQMQGAGPSTFFLWAVRKDELWEHILNDMYHAALNLSQRATYMIEQDPEILGPKQMLPEQQRKEKTAQQKRWMILQSSLSKLDDAIMLFHDF